MKTDSLLLFLPLLTLVACDFFGARDEFDRQLEMCTVAENNGLVESALESCGAALAIAETEEYAPAEVSSLLYRLGRMQRQRSRFAEAEELMLRSLAMEEQAAEQGDAASRLIELALSVAGQGRWAEGAELLERASPHVAGLEERERTAADGAFRLFAVRLRNMGETELADRFQALIEPDSPAGAP